MHHLYATALYLALLKLDRLVDDNSQVMPLFRQDDPHPNNGGALHRSFTFFRGWGWGEVCMHACLSKCLLLWKTQCTLSEDFFLQICHLPQLTHSLLTQILCTTMRIFQCIWLSANPLMTVANDWVWFVPLLQYTNAGNTQIKYLDVVEHDARYVWYYDSWKLFIH